MKKKAVINFLKAMTAVAVAVAMLSTAAWLFHSKGSYHKMHEFYQYPNDYEVWFLGSSHTIMSTLPEELYDEYGIRSYNLACYGQTFCLDYWIARNLFRIAKPKLVVLDVTCIGTKQKYTNANISSVKKMITSLPFGTEKINAINDLFEGDLREEMLLPFASDHYNWEYLNEDYFRQEESYELGSDQNVFDGRGKTDYVLVTPTTFPEAIDPGEVKETDSINSVYFRKLIELCRDNDIEVLLVKCPRHTGDDTLRLYNYAFAIGQEYGIPYLNGFEITDTFDGDTDMWDASHLNSLGARKWTHVLGQYISEHYPQIEKTTDNETMRRRWENRYEKYQKWLDTALPLQSHFYSFLMLCTNPRYSLEITIKNDSPVANDNIAMKLIGLCAGEVAFTDGDKTDCEISIRVHNADGEQVDSACFTSEADNTYKRQRP